MPAEDMSKHHTLRISSKRPARFSMLVNLVCDISVYSCFTPLRLMHLVNKGVM